METTTGEPPLQHLGKEYLLSNITIFSDQLQKGFLNKFTAERRNPGARESGFQTLICDRPFWHLRVKIFLTLNGLG